MKKLISIVLVVVLAFSLSTVALGADVTIGPPVNVEDQEWPAPPDPVIPPKNVTFEPKEPSDGAVLEIWQYEDGIFGINGEDVFDNELGDYVWVWTETIDLYEVALAEVQSNVTVDTISQIGRIFFGTVFEDSWTNPYGVPEPYWEWQLEESSGWVTVKNVDWSGTVRILQMWREWDDEDEFTWVSKLIEGANVRQLADGSWQFWVEDLNWWSWFFALIERGFSPNEAAKIVLSGTRSPQTSDSSIHAGIILLIVLASAGSVLFVSLRKAKQED